MTMRTFTLLASTAAFVLVASAAGAQTSLSGQVTLTGFVNDSCEVSGGAPAPSFSTSIALGELAQGDGTLSPTLAGYTATSTPEIYQTTVSCNTLTPKVEVTATELIDSAITTVPTGYANAVNYSADALVTETTGSDTFTATTNGTTAGHTGPTAVTNPIANVNDNLTIKAYGFSTVGGATNILLSSGGAPAYSGVITVTITPS